MKRISPAIWVWGLIFSAQTAQADWTAAKRITWTSGVSIHPAIAIDPGKTLHVVWYDDTPGNPEIYYKKSTDGGASWSAAQRLSWNSGASSDPAIAIGMDNSINVVWEDSTLGHYELYYRRSADGGSTWSSAQRLTWTSSACRAPAMAIDGDNRIHVAWYEYTQGNIEIHYRRSPDGGSTWDTAQRLTWNLGNSYNPAMASDSNQNVRVVWYDDWSATDYEIYYKHSTDGGSAWSLAKRLTRNSGSSCYPAIALDSDGVIHVVWMDSTPGTNQIYHARSLDGGTTWSAAKRLTWTTSECYSPAIASDSSKYVHVVWYNETAGNYQIYYKKSTDKGLTWTSAQKLSGGSGYSLDPVIAVDSVGTIHVVWRDAAPGNYEIYYRNGK
jgi:hypothetical protein